MEKFRPITEDAFGRQKVSTPYTLFDAHHRYKLSDKFYSVLTNGGTVTHLIDDSTALLSITSTSGSSVVYESTTVQPYQPGKSLLIMLTFVMGIAPNTTYRAGYFGTLNGIFFEVNNGIAYIVKRNKGVETRIAQSDWNMNKLPMLDVTKAQIFWIDIEWLGVGRVRCGFIIGGVQIPCHAFFHANIETGVYMTTAILPIRFELFGTGGTQTTMKQICATVMSEGGYQIKTNGFSQYRKLRLVESGKNYPCISIRLKSSNLDAVVILSMIDILVDTTNIRWRIYKNVTTLSGASFTAHAQSNLVEIDVSATEMTLGNAVLIFEGFAYQRQTVSIDVSDYNQQLTRTTTYDVYTLALEIVDANSNKDVLALMKWNEF